MIYILIILHTRVYKTQNSLVSLHESFNLLSATYQKLTKPSEALFCNERISKGAREASQPKDVFSNRTLSSSDTQILMCNVFSLLNRSEIIRKLKSMEFAGFWKILVCRFKPGYPVWRHPMLENSVRNVTEKCRKRIFSRHKFLILFLFATLVFWPGENHVFSKLLFHLSKWANSLSIMTGISFEKFGRHMYFMIRKISLVICQGWLLGWP